MNEEKDDPTNPRSKELISASMVLLLGVSTATAQSTGDARKSGFENPPQIARPRVWWHWMNGNITQEGIKLDLEWMHRIGLGGFQNFHAALSTPQVVEQRLAYMTPEWKDAFRYATVLADQLGLEEAIEGSPGWSESGGPRVPASQGMKKYVWSETFVEGGEPFTGAPASATRRNPSRRVRTAKTSGPSSSCLTVALPSTRFRSRRRLRGFSAWSSSGRRLLLCLRGRAAWTPLHWESKFARVRPITTLPNWCCVRVRASTGLKRRPPSPPYPTSISSRHLRSLRPMSFQSQMSLT